MLSILPSLIASLAPSLPDSLPNPAQEARSGGQAKKSPFNYTYVEGNLARWDIDSVNENLDGIELIGSLSLQQGFFAQVGASLLSGDIDMTELRIGGGYHTPLAPNLDGYGMLSYVNWDFDSGIGDEDGFAIDAGVRYMASPQVEVGGYLEWADIADSELGLGVNGRYYIDDKLSIGMRLLFIDPADQIALGVRYQF